jgi:hypothetical protein
MSYNLFIDDCRDPIDVKWGTIGQRRLYREEEWLIARNWLDVLELVISLGFPQLISFDHDLGECQETGHDIAKRLCAMVLDGVELPENFTFLVHSKNPVGAANIRNYMEAFLNSREGRK